MDPIDKNTIKHDGDKLTLLFKSRKKRDAARFQESTDARRTVLVKKSNPKRFLVYGC